MLEWKKDKTNRNLGKQRHICRICGAEGEFDTYRAREMMQGTREEFLYFACDSCKCLQIAAIPENLGDYYGKDYYSFQVPEETDMEFDVPVVHLRKVLDVGCGGGAWLLEKAKEGWGNLYGCDPFLESGRRYGQRVTIYNCSIHEIEGDGTFDIIHMDDSFEHMTDPLEVLQSARRLLKPDGILYMDIPTYPNIAFERFGPHWYQLDAPRHIFLHSTESLKWLGRASGMKIFDIKYNSNDSQFIRSYLYQHGIPFWEQKKMIGQYLESTERERLKKEAVIWNEKEYGDHMEVYWHKSALPVEKKAGKVIFQRMSNKVKEQVALYPPVYREPDTEYICFTDDPCLSSSYWKIQRVEAPMTADLEPYLKSFGTRLEIQPNQVQMGPLFEEAYMGENLVTVPSLEELPLVKLDLERFEPTADENGNYCYRQNPICQTGKYNGRPLLLTIGVPVSNQIDTIERCLFHIKPLLDELDAELLVVDTGSTDGTIEVCKKYGARIVSCPWCDNMSKVRNEAIYHARGLWYLSIDDDEWFEDVEDILRFFQKGIYKDYNMATYIQRNYMDSEGRIFEDHHTTRMAEVTPQLHFEGRIHDALIIRGHNKSYMLNSYAHHYGFVNDRPDKVKEKFLRNTSILLYDVYEYPNDLRYLFQLANEYCTTHFYDVAIGLLAKTIALAIKAENQYRQNISLTKIFDCLYGKEDLRLFSWPEYLKKLCTLTVAEQAGIAWSKEVLAFQLGRPVVQTLTYYEEYEKLLDEYRQEPGASRYLTFSGLAKVEVEFFAMDADAIAFCSYLRIGEEEKAQLLLERISLEVLDNRRIAIFASGFMAGDAVYETLCAKMTALQWEEWSETVWNAVTYDLVQDEKGGRKKKRFFDILSKVSVSTVISWVENSQKQRGGSLGKCLTEYAFSCVAAYIEGEEVCVQALCFCAWILKEAYVEKRREEKEGCEGGQTFRVVMKNDQVKEWRGADSQEILYRYVIAMGAFADRYYHPEQLTDTKNHAVAPDILAAYRMAAVLLDGEKSRENVEILKQALEIFPPFHEEIKEILMSLGN